VRRATREHPRDPDLAAWKRAIQLRLEHPRWVVLWLSQLGCYRAYPHFRLKGGAPYVSAPAAEDLVSLMDEAEQASKPQSPRGQQA
jgi:hypothetical protein